MSFLLMTTGASTWRCCGSRGGGSGCKQSQINGDCPGYSQKNPHVVKQYFNGQYNGVKVYARVCTPLWITAPGYVWKHKRGGVVSQNSTLHLARLSDLEDLAVGRSRQKVIKTHEYYPTVGYGIMTSGRIIGGDYFNLHTRAHEGPMMYGRILPMFFGTVRFLPNDHGYYLTEFRSYASSTKNTYDATVDPGLTLDLGSVPWEGYATMSPAKKYFAVPGKKLIESWPIPALPEVVQITAHGLPGYGFVGWQGDGGCWPYKPCEDELVFDPPLALEDTDCTNDTIWIAMDDHKTIIPQFVEAHIDDFEYAPTFESYCANKGVRMRGPVSYTWTSSTGCRSDLTGHVVEVISRDRTVTVEDMISCLEGMAPGVESGATEVCAYFAGVTETSNSSGAWTDIVYTGPEYPRFYKLAHSTARSGGLLDAHSWDIPCSVTCQEGSYQQWQFFFHDRGCLGVEYLDGPFEVRWTTVLEPRRIDYEFDGHYFPQQELCTEWSTYCPCE